MHSDGDFDRAIRQLLLGKAMPFATGFELGSLDGVGLQELPQMLLRAPVAVVVVIAQLPGLQLTDNWVAPVGQLHTQPSSFSGKEVVLSGDRLRDLQTGAGSTYGRCISDFRLDIRCLFQTIY